MKKNIGIILLIIGVVMIAYTGINYVTTEKVVDLGPIEINKEQNHTIQWPPIAGVVFIIGGGALLFLNKKSRN